MPISSSLLSFPKELNLPCRSHKDTKNSKKNVLRIKKVYIILHPYI